MDFEGLREVFWKEDWWERIKGILKIGRGWVMVNMRNRSWDWIEITWIGALRHARKAHFLDKLVWDAFEIQRSKGAWKAGGVVPDEGWRREYLAWLYFASLEDWPGPQEHYRNHDYTLFPGQLRTLLDHELCGQPRTLSVNALALGGLSITTWFGGRDGHTWVKQRRRNIAFWGKAGKRDLQGGAYNGVLRDLWDSHTLQVIITCPLKHTIYKLCMNNAGAWCILTRARWNPHMK